MQYSVTISMRMVAFILATVSVLAITGMSLLDRITVALVLSVLYTGFAYAENVYDKYINNNKRVALKDAVKQ